LTNGIRNTTLIITNDAIGAEAGIVYVSSRV
jgi:hypothetical protein